MTENQKISLPKTKKGRKTIQERLIYESELRAFGYKLKELQYKIAGTIHIGETDKISSRGWCYLLEGFRTIDKSQFDTCQKTINLCRKEGYLPIDFVAIDESRQFYHVESLIEDYKEPKEFIYNWLEYIKNIDEYKEDVAFWDSQEYYIQMMVEKIDVLNLFHDICEIYHIPIANAKGWSDLNSRNKLALRFKKAEELGLKPILLYYGDFDPAGLKIANTLKKNLYDIEKATEWNPDNLIIDRFGLTYSFIKENNLLWIDNLITGNKKNLANTKHPDHNKKYVQSYIKKYGIRKCEANAILPIRDIAIVNCEKTIQKYLGKKPHEKYEEKLKEHREEVKTMLEAINFKKRISELIEDIKKLDHDSD